VLTEAAVRNTILHLRGVDTMRDFLQRQQQRWALIGPAADGLAVTRAPML